MFVYGTVADLQGLPTAFQGKTPAVPHRFDRIFAV
jgi:hypothetical protein